jgi:hypothetical protein
MFIVRLLGNEILDELPWRQALGKQSVAKLHNSRTAVLRNPFLGNGSINTLPWIHNNMGRWCFLCGPCRGVFLKTPGVPQVVSKQMQRHSNQLVVGNFQVNARCSKQSNSGTSGGSKRSGTRGTEEYKRSACEDAKFDWKISCVIFVAIWSDSFCVEIRC